MNSGMERLINHIRSKSLREKVAKIVESPQIQIDGAVYSGLPLEDSPAGRFRHHSYPGGLVEHIVATGNIALNICDVVEHVYQGKVNLDYVIAGIILHDIFKPATYVEEEGRYYASPLGERLNHLTLAASDLIHRGFPLDLVHIVSAHHGGQASPIRPRTVEALICHLADYADSQLNGEVLRAARFLLRSVTGEELPLLTSREAFEIVHSKTVKGWDGVNKAVRRIVRRRSRYHG